MRILIFITLVLLTAVSCEERDEAVHEAQNISAYNLSDNIDTLLTDTTC